jgi:predicted RNase H-like HicB family nuclease
MTIHETVKRAQQHLELAVKFLAEGRELIDEDPIQASENFTKRRRKP